MGSDLKGRTNIITGASSGIGKTATTLLAVGGEVVWMIRREVTGI